MSNNGHPEWLHAAVRQIHGSCPKSEQARLKHVQRPVGIRFGAAPKPCKAEVLPAGPRASKSEAPGWVQSCMGCVHLQLLRSRHGKVAERRTRTDNSEKCAERPEATSGRQVQAVVVP
jgi:hypothetical protein